MLVRYKRIFSFILAMLLLIGHISPIYAQTSDKALLEENSKESVQEKSEEDNHNKLAATAQNKSANEYELDIVDGVLYGFVSGKEPNEAINLVIPSEVNTIAKRAFYNSTKINAVDFSHATNLKIEEHAFQNANLKGELNINGVLSIGDYGFADNGIADIKAANLDSIGERAFRQNDISDLDINVNTIANGAFEENKITSATIESNEAPTLGQAIFQSNPLTKLTLITPDFDISQELFTGVNEKVVVKFDNTNQISKDTSSYLVNPIDIEINYVNSEDNSTIESHTDLVQRDAKPYEIDEPSLAGYKLLPTSDYTIKDGKISFTKTPINLLFKVSEDPEIRFSSIKKSLYLWNTEVSTKDILSDVYIKKVNGEVVPAIDENGNILEGLNINPRFLPEVSRNVKKQEVQFTYKEKDKQVEETFIFNRSSNDIMKEEIGNGWRYEDFVYSDNTILRFSGKGIEKLNNGNRDVVLPGINPTQDNRPIENIYKYAFRNKNLERVDFSQVTNLKTIGDEAFKNNNIKSVNFSKNPSLKLIQKCAFEYNKLTNLDLSATSIEIIETSAFSENLIENFELNKKTIKELHLNAFRTNKIKNVEFNGENGDYANLERIDSDVFGYNELESYILKNLPKLKGKVFLYAGLNNLELVNLPLVTSIIHYGAYTNISNIRVNNLPSLIEIGKDTFAYDNKYSGERNISIENIPNLEIIGNSAFQNNLQKEMFIKNTPKLHTIGERAFLNNNFEDLDLTVYPNLKFIGRYAFAKNETNLEPYKNIKISGLQNLETIGRYAFYTSIHNKNNEDNELSFNLTDLPKLKTIENDSFLGLRIRDLQIKNLPELENLQGFNYNKIQKLVIKDLPKVKILNGFLGNDINYLEIDLESLEEIFDKTFTGYNAVGSKFIDKFEINAPKLKRIGKEAFSYIIREDIDLSKLTSLEVIGEKAFNYYQYDSKLQKIIFPETTKAIRIYDQAFALTTTEKDLSDQKNIKLEPYANRFISGPLQNPLVLDNSDNLYVNYDRDDFSKSFPIKNPLTIHIKNNDIDGDGKGDWHSKEGLLINPQRLTIKPFYYDENGVKQYFKEVEYIISENKEFEPPIISGFISRENIIYPEYSNVTINEDKEIEVEYARIVADDALNVKFNIKKLNPENDILMVNSRSSKDAVYEIQIDNSGQNQDFDLKDIIVDIQLPEHFDPSAIEFPSINTLEGIKILNIDPNKGTIKIKIDKLDRGSSITIPGIFKFLAYETPKDFEGTVQGRVSFDYQNNKKTLTSESKKYKVTYKNPSFRKNGDREINSHSRKIDDLEINYRFDVMDIYRKVKSYTIYDNLPKYISIDENGNETTKIAKFDPNKNPGWEVVEEKDGIPTKIKYSMDNLDFIDYTQFGSIPQTSRMKFPTLTLDFPNAKTDQFIRNSTNLELKILDPEFNDRDYNLYDSHSTHVRYTPLQEPGDFKKEVDKKYIALYPGKDEEFITWDIRYRNGSYYTLADGSKDERYEIKSENIIINDYIYRYPNIYEQYYSVIPEKDAYISLVRLNTSKKEYNENDIILKDVFVKAGEEYIISEDIRDDIKLIHINYKGLSLGYGESINAKIKTKVKDFEKSMSYHTETNYAAIFFDNVKYDLSHDEESRKGELVSSRNLTDSVNAYFSTPQVSSNVFKKQEKIGYNEANNEVIDYKIGSSLTPGSYANLIPRYQLKEFRQVDILPPYVNILKIEMSSIFETYAGTYTIEALDDGRTKVVFSSKNFKIPTSTNVEIANIQVEILPEAPSNLTIINGTYNDFSNEEVKRNNTRKQPLENDRELSYAEVSFRILKPQKSGAYKYIRRNGENWTRSLETTPGENIQYLLSINEINQVNKTDISILDIFPHRNDITIVENQAGLRNPRESQLSNIYKGIESIQYIDSDDKTWDVTDKFDIMYINDLKGHPITLSDGTIDEWAESKAEAIQKGNPAGLLIKSKEGVEFKAPYKLQVVVNMQVPGKDVFPLDKYYDWEYRAAFNSFARKDNSIPQFIENNPVKNVMITPFRDIYFKKVDENGEPLADSKFVLKMDEHKDKYAYSDDEGNVIFRHIPFKEFTVYEVSPTKGYKLNLEKYFNDGEFKENEGILHTFKNEKVPDKGNPDYKVVINKKDYEGKDLPRIKFELTSLSEDKTYVKETDENGYIEFTNLYKGSYKLSEIQTVNNLQAIEDIFFEINEENDLEKNKTFTFDLVNDKYKVNLYKLGMYHYDKVEEDTDLYTSSGRPLAGVQFNLYEYNNGQKKFVSKAITDEKGKLQFTGVSPNIIYAIKEMNMPNAYVKNEDLILFKVDGKGKVYKLVDNNGTGYTEVPYKENGLIVSNYPERKLSAVEVIKKDDNGNLIKGAEFTLYKENKGRYTKYATAISGENGIARFEKVIYGGYRLVETKAPEGYIGSNEVKTFILDGKESKLIKFNYENKETKLRIVKVEKIAGAFATEEEALEYKDKLKNNEDIFVKNATVYRSLSGAEFELKDGEKVIEPLSTKDENGYTVYEYNKIDVDKTYTLKEVKAPEEYNPAREMTIKGSDFKKQRQIEILLENSKQTGELKIYKYSEEKGISLADVKFALFKSKEDAKDPTKAIYTTEKTDSNGYTILKNIPYGTYYVKEIESPREYKISDEVREVKIGENTTSMTLSFYNETTTKEIVILKLESRGKALEGAKFELYRKADDIYNKDTLIATGISDKDGHVKFEGLPVSGKYYIKEISAPEGYVTFEGKVDIDDLLNNDYKDENQIKIVNKKLINLDIVKEWKDSNDLTIDAPVDKISVQVYRNGQVFGDPIELESSSDWKYTLKNIESNDPETFAPYTYTVKEIHDGKAVEAGTWIKFGEYDFVSSYSDIKDDTITITNKREELINISGRKTWDDKENQDGIRPESIKIKLLADGKKVDEKTVGSQDAWEWTFTNLPKYTSSNKNVEIKYTIEEEAVEGYETKFDGFNVTNTHIPEMIEIEGSKTWDDKENQDGIRPNSIKINLFADGEFVETKEVTAADKWTWKFTDLDKYADGKEIEYTITEDTVDGYETEIDGFNITNTHTPETIEIEGSKTWDDKENQDGIRPNSIKINLFADGEFVETKEVTAADKWTWKFTDLDKYADGKEIEYTITEDAVKDYSTVYKGFDIINEYTPDKTSITVLKNWDDKNNQDGIRSKSVIVKLFADGKDTGKTLELSQNNNWKDSFTELDVYKEGKEILYTIKEEKVSGYDIVKITGNASEGFVITNTYTPETIEIEGSKTWDDKENQDGIRPDSIKINLFADGEFVETKEVRSKDKWTWKFTDLYKYAEGKEIEYTITEDKVDGYETKVDGFNVTNTHIPETIEIKGSKRWNDKDNQDGIRPKSITIRLYSNGKEIMSKVVTEKDGWSWIFDNLEKYHDGKEIVYTIKEDSVANYKSEVKGYNVINTYIPKKTKNPNTGDEMNIALYLGILVLSFGALYISRKKTKKY